MKLVPEQFSAQQHHAALTCAWVLLCNARQYSCLQFGSYGGDSLGSKTCWIRAKTCPNVKCESYYFPQDFAVLSSVMTLTSISPYM